jgi:hypothetical protein
MQFWVLVTLEEMRNAYKILLKNHKVRDQLVDLAIDWRIILKWTLENRV